MQLGKIVKTGKNKKGKEVVIRYPKWEDLDDMTTFINTLSQEDTFILSSGETKSREEEIEYLSQSIAKMEKEEKIQLVATVDGAFAGNAEIRRSEKRQKHVGSIGISVAAEYREEGVGTELLKALIDEGRHLGLRLLTLSCFENNPRALHVYEKLGFKRAGMIPGVYAYKGTYIGEITLYLPLIS